MASITFNGSSFTVDNDGGWEVAVKPIAVFIRAKSGAGRLVSQNTTKRTITLKATLQPTWISPNYHTTNTIVLPSGESVTVLVNPDNGLIRTPAFRARTGTWYYNWAMTCEEV